MVIGFVTWSIVAVIFLSIGITCRRSDKATGFFTFVEPPAVTDVKQYNKAVSILWFGAAVILEVLGLPLLFAKQNSPVFIFMIIGMMLLVIGMAIVYLRIEAKYRK
ncbi:hypothetical protein [Parablautia sp. Marseille-Q6255]|uniref:hypothetical protein n=1 Tax=Parablautia sp. Marseille-Q6255 TaxID=3039593 RepID=UPI0024BBF4C7|nr:hypothetical protein [Parablautia sp. Marseille-Q6255]